MKEIPVKNYQLIDGPLSLEQIQILSGANYFSADRVIRLRINLNEFDEVFSDEIPGLYEKLVKKIPSLIEHHCSVGERGGFLLRVKEGTLLGHILEHVSLELKHLAGMEAGFGKTRMTKIQGVYNVVYRFVDEVAGVYAGVSAFNFLNSILTEKDFDIDEVIAKLIEIRNNRLLGFSTQAIVNEAEKRGILWERLDDYNLVQLGSGKHRRLIRATITEKTSLIAVETTDDKYRTTSILKEAGYPVPERIITTSHVEAIEFFRQLGKPVVTKPAFGNQGKGISLNISDEAYLIKAFARALKYDEEVIVQEHITGFSYRILVIDNKFVAAAVLESPFIVGDGKSSIEQLVEKLNQNPERSESCLGKLSTFSITNDSLELLETQNLNLKSVLEDGRKFQLCNSGNYRLGGKAIDVTDNVHIHNRLLAEHVSKILNLDVAGIDIISEDISIPLFENSGKLIEINAAPDFRLHINPFEGLPRPVESAFVDMLFPDADRTRIPIFSVVGYSGCSLLIDILYFWLSEKGLKTGKVKSNGLYTSGNLCLKQLDEISSKDIKTLLSDPTLDFALTEVPVKSILKDGLGYKFADIGIVLNMDFSDEKFYAYDHIRDEEDLAYAVSVVAEEVYDEGFTILNADNTLIAGMAERCYSKIAFFSQDTENLLVKNHLNQGNEAAILENNCIYVCYKSSRFEVFRLNDKEIISNETIEVILASALTMLVWGENTTRISEILNSFWKNYSGK
ncbi:MAG: ATP-grasp domain-containing protein [Bacteroidales bacterium]|nr:ATP-grasp domain-containing protein [Bacteroidales bacterium]